VAAALPGVEVVADELVDGRETGAAAAARIAAATPDAVLVVQSMAVPPAYTLAALDALDGVPLVVWVLHRQDGLPDGFDHSDITTEGATVGGPQLTNVLHRRGRRHELVVGRLHDPACVARVDAAVRAAGAAGRLRRARIARIGRPIDGYDCVDVDDAALLAATGIELVSVAPAAFRDAYRTAPAERVAAIEAETRAVYAVDAGLAGDEGLPRSLRAAAALEALVGELGVDAGAMNCHVDEIRLGPEPGIAPCFALGRETSRGVPWTCTGDVVTAVAMLTTTLLGGAAIYHELESLDYRTDEVLIANSGEHDLAWAAPGERPALIRNHWFASDPVCGACACFGGPAGPATLVAFTPHAGEPSGFRYVVAEGELTARRFPQTGTVHGAFVFRDGPVDAAWARWAGAGANHHSSATPGHLGDAVAAVARHLGVGCARVA